MKKLGALLMTGCLLMGTLCGCGGTDAAGEADSTQAADGSTTITIWHDKEDAVMRFWRKVKRVGAGGRHRIREEKAI